MRWRRGDGPGFRRQRAGRDPAQRERPRGDPGFRAAGVLGDKRDAAGVLGDAAVLSAVTPSTGA
ncbi:hypothetical protein J2853_002104 [Streptosporangium lutulentum]|uniref:Uncharacterized protein n=1 Tax=Streptosporangium lutulentum TaxID=1461250 RepID=A0ABT9Q829_9ACTN|nr:hypothetical protein [Streptosporangium lutulentum]MDP9842893.1 hypothetical protein [Streptosporangium lutulentum]